MIYNQFLLLDSIHAKNRYIKWIIFQKCPKTVEMKQLKARGNLH